MLRSVYPPISASEVQLWLLPLTAIGTHLEALSKLLSKDERERAARFVFEKDRCAFILRRGALRFLLHLYLDKPADQIGFHISATGKPSVASATSLCFNTSHSGSLAVIAITQACELGVDVEMVKRIDEMDAIARQFFPGNEISSSSEPRAFYHGWTRKEAFLKATGEGLPGLRDYARLDPAEASQWTIHNFDYESEYAGAIAYKAKPKCLQIMDSPSVLSRLDEY